MKVTEQTIFEGTPQEIDRFMNGPKQDDAQMRAHELAIKQLIRRTDDLHKGIETLLGVSDAGNSKKTKK